jgi:hypothetical protein
MKEVIEKKNVKKGLCAGLGCSNKSPTRRFCNTCRSRKARLKDPIRYAWTNLKSSAKRRFIFFDLTLEEFVEFCYESEYMSSKGRTIGTYNVDRIVEGKLPGYTRSNIQKLEKVDNIKKYKKYDAMSKKAVDVIEVITPAEDLPF